MNRILTTLLLTTVTCLTFGQSSYQKRISSEFDIVGHGIAFLPDSGLALTIQHTEEFGSDYRLSIVRTAEDGSILWVKQVLESAVFTVPSVIPVSSGGMLIVTEVGDLQALMALRLNADGDSIWTKTYPIQGVSMMPKVIECADGGFVIASYSFSHHVLSKLDSEGNIIWTRVFSGDDTPEGNVFDLRSGVIETHDSGFVSVGYGYTDLIANSNTFIQKTDANGNPLWNHISGGEAQECYRAVVELKDSTLLAVGYSKSFGDGNDDILLSRFSAEGDPIWTKTFDSGENDHVMDMEIMEDGDVILCGYARNDGSIPVYSMVIGLDSQGELEWARSIPSDASRVVASTRGVDGSIYMTGIERVSANDFDALLFKSDSLGRVGCGTDTLILEEQGQTLSYAIADLQTGGLDTVQYTAPYIDAGYELLVICDTLIISDTVITNLTSILGPHNFKVFLDPASRRLIIESMDWSSLGAELNVYSIEGRLVKASQLTEPSHSEIDLSDFPSGVYIFQLMQNGRNQLNGRVFLP